MNEIEVIMRGRVLLPNGIEHACDVRCRAVEQMVLVLPADVEPGTRLVCHVEDLGIVEGLAGITVQGDVDLRVEATPRHLSRLASRLDWHRRMASGQVDQRGSGRIVPTVTEVCVRLSCGSEMTGTLIDLSAGGAALRLPIRPEIGAAVVVGRRRAMVVRHTEEGVAIRFRLPLRPQDVTPDVRF